jgi:hypothetical protein
MARFLATAVNPLFEAAQLLNPFAAQYYSEYGGLARNPPYSIPRIPATGGEAVGDRAAVPL